MHILVSVEAYDAKHVLTIIDKGMLWQINRTMEHPSIGMTFKKQYIYNS